jgi:hypothetical protein
MSATEDLRKIMNLMESVQDTLSLNDGNMLDNNHNKEWVRHVQNIGKGGIEFHAPMNKKFGDIPVKHIQFDIPVKDDHGDLLIYVHYIHDENNKNIPFDDDYRYMHDFQNSFIGMGVPPDVVSNMKMADYALQDKEPGVSVMTDGGMGNWIKTQLSKKKDDGEEQQGPEHLTSEDYFSPKM